MIEKVNKSIDKTSFYDIIYRPDNNREVFWKIFAEYVQKKFIPKDSSLLDVAAGYCNFTNNIQIREKWAIDKQPNVEKFADKDTNVIVGDCLTYDYEKGLPHKVDVIFMSNFLEHVPKNAIVPMFKRLRKVCNRRIIVLGPNYKYTYKHYYDDPTHITALTHTTIKWLMELSGFKIEKTYKGIVPFSVEGVPGKQLPLIPSWIIKLYIYSPIKLFAGQFLVVGKV